MIRAVFFSVLGLSILLLCVLRARYFEIEYLQATIIGILITAGGICGTFILGYIESQKWGAISYFGSVFFVPIIMFFYAKIIQEPFLKIMDYCTPSGCVAVAVGKVFCKINGCCGGRTIGMHADGSIITFPSQIAEMILGVVLLFLFLYIERKKYLNQKRYQLFLVLYGAGRFVLNYFRKTTQGIGIIPDGALWSIVSFVLGVVWLYNYGLIKETKNG